MLPSVSLLGVWQSPLSIADHSLPCRGWGLGVHLSEDIRRQRAVWYSHCAPWLSHCPSSSLVSYQQRPTPVCVHRCLKVSPSLFFHYCLIPPCCPSSCERVSPSEMPERWWPRAECTLAIGSAFDGLNGDLWGWKPLGRLGWWQRGFKLVASDSESCIIKTQIIFNGHI